MLSSSRLFFKEYEQDDFEHLYSIFSNARVMKYAYLDQVTDREDLKSYFDNILQNNKTTSNRKAYEYAIYLADSNQYIGFADIRIHKQNDSGGCGDIGYFLLPDFWGLGYATEIANTLLKICFTSLGLHKASACCNTNNTSSEHIMQKIGMMKEGEIRMTRYKDGRWDNELTYGILIEEWKQFVRESKTNRI